MSNTSNATCAICGKPYEVCRTCQSITSFKPWRTITDTMECYKIYMIIHQYTTKTLTISEAKKQLSVRELPETLQSHIRKIVDEIMAYKETPVNATISDIKESIENIAEVKKITYQKEKTNYKYKKKDNEQ